MIRLTAKTIGLYLKKSPGQVYGLLRYRKIGLDQRNLHKILDFITHYKTKSK